MTKTHKLLGAVILLSFLACSKSTRSSTSSLTGASLLSPGDISNQQALQRISEEAATSVNAEFSMGSETFTATQEQELGRMECIRPVFVQNRKDKGKVEGIDFVVDDTLPTFSRFDETLGKFVTEHPIVDPVANPEDGSVTYEVYAAAYDTKCGSRNLIGKCMLFNYGHNARKTKFNTDKKNGLVGADEIFPVEPKYIQSGWQNCMTPNSNETDMYEQIFKQFVLNALPGDEIVFQMWLADGAGNSTFKSYNFQKITGLL